MKINEKVAWLESDKASERTKELDKIRCYEVEKDIYRMSAKRRA